MKKTYLVMAILIVLLYVAIILDQSKVIGLGELFGYLLYVVIVCGIVAAVWSFVRPTEKKE